MAHSHVSPSKPHPTRRLLDLGGQGQGQLLFCSRAVEPTFFSADDRPPASILAASGDSEGIAAFTPIFAFAADWGSDAELIDAGAEPRLGDPGGRLGEAFAEAGISRTRVARVLLTRLHPNYVGRLSDEEGHPLFPDDEVVLSHWEWAELALP
jgi:hypothetical protein